MNTYTIAVSYASEQRYYVEKFVDYFIRKNINIYYDRNEQTQMLGTLLHEKLQEIYTEDTYYRIIFLSKDYIDKPITKMESEYILADNVYQKNKLYVFKFDETTLPGLNRNFVYSTIKDYPNPEDYAELIYDAIKKKTLVSQNIEYSIFEKIRLQIEQYYYKYNNLQIQIDEKNSTYSLELLLNGETHAFFQIQRKNDNIFKLWCYPYKPFDIDYSYNGFIEHIFFIPNSFILYNMGVDDTMKFQLGNMNFVKLCSTISSKIIKIFEERYDQ